MNDLHGGYIQLQARHMQKVLCTRVDQVRVNVPTLTLQGINPIIIMCVQCMRRKGTGNIIFASYVFLFMFGGRKFIF